MEVTETISCPFCGQAFEIAVDTSVEHQTFVLDCEVCCRPLTIRAECDPGSIRQLQVDGL